MKRVFIQENWNDVWKYSYPYDLLEVYGEIETNLGYAYAYQNRVKHTLSLIQSVAKPGDKILDVGAAQGNLSLRLAELGYSLTWNDFRSELSEYVEMKRESGSIEYRCGDVFKMKFEQPYDVVVATEIIEHVAHPDEFLLQLAKLVKPNGYIVITTPLGSYFKNHLPRFSEFADPSVFESKQFGPNSDDHIFLLHLDEMKPLAKRAGLEIKSMKYYTNPLTNGHFKTKGLLKILSKKVVLAIEQFTQLLPEFLGKRLHNNFAVLFQKS